MMMGQIENTPINEVAASELDPCSAHSPYEAGFSNAPQFPATFVRFLPQCAQLAACTTPTPIPIRKKPFYFDL